MKPTTLDELFAVWPERCQVPVRIHMYPKGTFMLRCTLEGLRDVFRLAEVYGVQERISTNLNCMNAVYVDLDNFVLRNRKHISANKGGWGDHYSFLLGIAACFPGEVFVDTPDESAPLRYRFDEQGNITETIETCDDMS